jgi:V8-like Glu-specific endopeptidase
MLEAHKEASRPMKTLIAVLAALLLPACAILQSAQEFSGPRAQVKFIEIPGRGACSAIVIAPGRLLTAAHCAEHEGFELDGKPVATVRLDAPKDLAIMSVEGLECPCASLASAPPALDEPVIIVGFPLGRVVGVQYVTLGRFQGMHADGEMALSAHAAPGNSGGGVFVYRGGEWQLIGVLVSGAGGSGGGSYITFAVPLASILDFLRVA